MIQAAKSSFDRITAMAAAVFDAPMSVVTLLDEERAVFHGRLGMELIVLPRGASVGTHIAALGRGGVMILPDASQDPRTCDHPMVTGEPHVRWFVGATVCTPDGVPVGALNVMDTRLAREAPTDAQLGQLQLLAEMVGDIVERERDRRGQTAQLKMLQMAESVSNMGHWHVDLLAKKVTWSQEVYRIHGVDPKVFMPTRASVLDRFPEEDRERLNGFIQRALTTGEGYEYITPLVREDGSRRQVSVEATVETDITGKPTALFGVIRDVTEEQEALARVARSEARYRLLADHMGDVIMRIRPDGQGAYVSPACQVLLGWTLAEMAVQSSAFFVHPDDHATLWAATKRAFGGEVGQRLEYRLLHKNGHHVWVEGNFQPVPDAEGGGFANWSSSFATFPSERRWKQR